MSLTATTFQTNLAVGKMGESRIANWMKKRGWCILPIYDIEINTGKGPQLFMPDKNIIAPDMLMFKPNYTFWIEAKTKTAFSWHRLTEQWVTGIDLCHYLDYCIVDDETPFPVWLLFLHEGGQAKDSPPNSPAGLFGNKLDYLRQNENHRHDNWGHSGMVYWSIKHLLKIAELADL